MIRVEKVEHEQEEQSIYLGSKQANLEKTDFKDKDIANI
jgi:hypothetical protein